MICNLGQPQGLMMQLSHDLFRFDVWGLKNEISWEKTIIEILCTFVLGM
jgi:hypothetical protein